MGVEKETDYIEWEKDESTADAAYSLPENSSFICPITQSPNDSSCEDSQKVSPPVASDKLPSTTTLNKSSSEATPEKASNPTPTWLYGMVIGFPSILAISLASFLYNIFKGSPKSTLVENILNCPVSLTDSSHPSLMEEIFEIDAGFNPLARMQIVKALLDDNVNVEVETSQANKLMEEIKSDLEKLESNFNNYIVGDTSKLL